VPKYSGACYQEKRGSAVPFRRCSNERQARRIGGVCQRMPARRAFAPVYCMPNAPFTAARFRVMVQMEMPPELPEVSASTLRRPPAFRHK